MSFLLIFNYNNTKFVLLEFEPDEYIKLEESMRKIIIQKITIK